MKVVIAVVAAASASFATAFALPTTWFQASRAGNPGKLHFAVATVPAANDVWMWTFAENSGTGYQPVAIMVPPPPPSAPFKWICITDISLYNNGGPSTWWIRDGNTGQILYGGAFGATNPRVSEHLSTPLVLAVGPNPATIELGGSDFGVQFVQQFPAGFRWSGSFVGRYIENQ